MPLYWSRGTAKHYAVVQIWKLKQLLKLSLGWWDRDTIEAFHVRDKVTHLLLDVRLLVHPET